MAVAGLYRRALPSPPAIEFASAAGKRLFSEALKSGTMEGFFKLISYFQTQSEPAYCGLASLSMVLNALGIDPGRKWKGPWRWFDETMLDCCEPLEKVKAEGITFAKVVCLAHCAGAKVEAFRTNESTIDDFRNHVIECTSTEECHVNVSYNRKAFMQTGTGHFSPIGGYHATSDMVLILDVARFKYPPHWVPLSLLWEAMDTIDEATGRPRGFMLISRLQKAPSILYTLNCRTESWVRTVKHLIDNAPRLLKSEDINSIPKVLSALLEPVLTNIGDFITWVAEIRRGGENGSNISNDEKGRNAAKEKVLEQVHQTELFKFVTEWISLVNSCCGNGSSSMDKNSLPEIATDVCRQGAELLTGSHTGSKEFICTATCIRCIGAKGDIPMTVLSGSVVSGINRQEVDMMVPMSKAKSTSFCSDSTACVGMHPGSNDLLTVLLLALPSNTWSGIKDEKLLAEIKSLVSTDNLPDVLQEEVLHLRRQMESLKRCKFSDAD